jgi:hypothetical protein
VGKTAVPAPYRDVAAPDHKIVNAINTAVPAYCRYRKEPYRPGPGFCKNPGFINVLYDRHENPRGATIFTGNVSPVGHDLNMLVCQLPAMVTIGGVIRADEPVAHERVFVHPGYH